MKNKLYKSLIKLNKKYRFCKTLPYKVQNETSKLCPYANQTSDVIVCMIDKKEYGCNPTPFCTFLLKK